MQKKSTSKNRKVKFTCMHDQINYIKERKRQAEERKLMEQKRQNAILSNQIYLARLRREEAERRNNPLNVAITAISEIITEDLETVRVGRLFNKK